MQVKEKLDKIPFSGNVENRAEQFQKILRKYDPNAAVKIRNQGHFLQYSTKDSTNNPNQTYLLNLKARFLKNTSSRQVTQKYIEWDDYELEWTRLAVGGTPGQKEEALINLRLGYKIHLMPKNDYMLAVIDKILEAAKNDPEFRDLFSEFKILTFPTKNALRSLKNSNIVIYPKLGHENAQKLVYKLIHLFSRVDISEIAEDQTYIPRNSASINCLIYYTQGGFNSKEYGKELQKTLQEIRAEKETKTTERKQDNDPKLINETNAFLTKHEVHYVGGKPLTSNAPSIIYSSGSTFTTGMGLSKPEILKKGKVQKNIENYALVQALTLNKDNSITFDIRSRHAYPGDIEDDKHRKNTIELFYKRHEKVMSLFKNSEFEAELVERSTSGLLFKINHPKKAYKLLKMLADLELDEPYNESFVYRFKEHFKMNMASEIIKRK